MLLSLQENNRLVRPDVIDHAVVARDLICGWAYQNLPTHLYEQTFGLGDCRLQSPAGCEVSFDYLYHETHTCNVQQHNPQNAPPNYARSNNFRAAGIQAPKTLSVSDAPMNCRQ